MSVRSCLDYSGIAEELAQYDACFWCVGRASRELDEQEYARVTYGFPVAAARAISPLNPVMRFFYVWP